MENSSNRVYIESITNVCSTFLTKKKFCFFLLLFPFFTSLLLVLPFTITAGTESIFFSFFQFAAPANWSFRKPENIYTYTQAEYCFFFIFCCFSVPQRINSFFIILVWFAACQKLCMGQSTITNGKIIEP